MTIILGFGPPLRIGGPTHAEADEHCFVPALHDSYAVTQEDGTLHGVQIERSPVGA